MRLLLILLLASTSLLAQSGRQPLRTAGAGKAMTMQPTGTGSGRFYVGPIYVNTNFSYSLDTSSLTSAAVRQLPDSTLIRTLWSGVRNQAGVNSARWDGLDDRGRAAGPGRYIVEVLSNNVRATWRGVIGNSSFVLGNTTQMHRGYQFIRQMVEVGDYVYFNQHYVEGASPVEKFKKTNPQVKFALYARGLGSGTGSEYLCSDGTRVYFTRYDHLGASHRNRTWVSALTASTDAAYSFSSGSSYTPKEAPAFPESVAGLIVSDSSSNHTAGIAVQRSGSALLVSYPGKSQIRVFDKLTGAQTATIRSLTSPRQIAVDGSDNVWVVSGTNTVARYTLSGGTLTSVLTLSGITTPMSVAVSTDGSTVYVADKATQQILAYNASTGAALWTLGQSGGYTSTSTVVDDRFYFSDLSGGVNYAAVCPTSDGSFWVTDVGNSRVQHFSAARAYIDNIAYIVSTYNSVVDANDSTRVFSSYQEFSVDYSKPFATSWKLTRNYRNQVPAVYLGVSNLRQSTEQFGVFPCLATLSNGRTYSLIKEYVGSSNFTLVELIPNAPLRVISSIKFTNPVNILADGSLNYTEQTTGRITWKKRALTEFDASNNPIWATAATDASAAIDALSPVDETGLADRRAGLFTANGKRVMFNAGLTRRVDGIVRGLGYHLGFVRPGATNWLAQTAYATSGPAYRGDYPTDGSYDVGNHGEYRTGNQNGYGGGDITVKDNLVFWPYYGEFWKGAQTNKWQLVHESGLFLTGWGPTNADDFYNKDIPGMAGGVHAGVAVRYNGGYRVWHGEEGGYSGIHAWDITNTRSIKKQTAAVVSPLLGQSFQLARAAGTTDLLAGLPRNDTLVTPVAGWSFTGSMVPGQWMLETSARSSDRFASPDLWIQFAQGNATQSATRTLPVSGAVASWSITAGVSFAGTLGTESKTDGSGNPISAGAYVDVLDAAGKIIARFYKLTQFEVNPASSAIMANTVSLVSAPPYGAVINAFNTPQPLSINRTGGKLNVSYGGFSASNLAVFETGADATRPVSIRVTCFDNNLRRDRGLAIQSLNFLVP